MNKDKRFGLILPNKNQLSAPTAKNIFCDEDDSDESNGLHSIEVNSKPCAGNNSRIKKQNRLNIQKAIADDPTIYQYDEVYDEMERKKDEQKAVKKESKKPKYIANLLKAAEKRKQDYDQRIERMVQKEREAEGEKFADKESFVTSAYRQQLEERKKLNAEQEKIDRLEEICDVTKQNDMSGFYRGLYAQTIDKKNNTEDTKVADSNDENHDSKLTGIDKDDVMSSSSSCSDSEDVQKKNISNSTRRKSRHYRKRAVEEEEEEEDEVDSTSDEEQSENNHENIDKSHKESEYRFTEDKSPAEKKSRLSVEPENEKNISSNQNTDEKDNASPNVILESKSEVNEKLIDTKKELENKVSIWEKRTVGEVYINAVQRYHARKALQAPS